jgi:prepilin-type N-terminal cleavage/methylation domain-containing protein
VRTSRAGVTLIELLLAIAVLAAIVMVATTAFNRYQKRDRLDEISAQISTIIQKAIQGARAEKRGFRIICAHDQRGAYLKLLAQKQSPLPPYTHEFTPYKLEQPYYLPAGYHFSNYYEDGKNAFNAKHSYVAINIHPRGIIPHFLLHLKTPRKTVTFKSQPGSGTLELHRKIIVPPKRRAS